MRAATAASAAAVRARIRPQSETWGRLERGDEVRVEGKQGRFRFLHVTLGDDDHGPYYVTVYGPLDSGREMMRSFRPESVRIPSQRSLNTQRRRRAA
jgi:hypothetical protein